MSIDSHLRQAIPTGQGRASGTNSARIRVAAGIDDVARTGNVRIRAAETARRGLNCGRPIRTERPAKQRRDNNDVAASIEEQMLGDPTAAVDTIKVKVDNGWITLTGQEAWYYRKVAEDRKVRRSHGAAHGCSQIMLEPDINILGWGNWICHLPRLAGLLYSQEFGFTHDDHVECTGTIGSETGRQVT